MVINCPKLEILLGIVGTGSPDQEYLFFFFIFGLPKNLKKLFLFKLYLFPLSKIYSFADQSPHVVYTLVVWFAFITPKIGFITCVWFFTQFFL